MCLSSELYSSKEAVIIDQIPSWDFDGGSDDPVLLPAADLRHDRPGAHQLGLVAVIPLLDTNPAGAVRTLHPHRVRPRTADQTWNQMDTI